MILTVAIDGPAAAGKGTIARAVAAAFGFAHPDTGLICRAVRALRSPVGDKGRAATMPRPAPGSASAGSLSCGAAP